MMTFISLFMCLCVLCIYANDDEDNQLSNVNDKNDLMLHQNYINIEHLLQRIERIERVFNISIFNPDLEDMSFLELFWTNFKTFAVNAIPSTNKECKFNYRTFSCEPKCTCSFQYIFGDYSFSRSCRLKKNPPSNCSQYEISNSKHILDISSIFSKIMSIINKNLPPTDKECSWSFLSFGCTPSIKCKFDMKMGDMLNLNRACRLREDKEVEEDDGEDGEDGDDNYTDEDIEDEQEEKEEEEEELESEVGEGQEQLEEQEDDQLEYQEKTEIKEEVDDYNDENEQEVGDDKDEKDILKEGIKIKLKDYEDNSNNLNDRINEVEGKIHQEENIEHSQNIEVEFTNDDINIIENVI